MPSISWRAARAEIAALLVNVAITDPDSQTIKRVYLTPHKTATDIPAVIIVGVAKGEPIRSSGLREREYTARLRLVVRDADIQRAADLIDAFQEAITDVFDQNLTLNGKVSNLNGPQWLEAGTVDIGGQEHTGCDALVRFRMFDDPGFAG